MTLRYEFLLFAIVFFGFMAVVGAVQAHRKKEKAYYIGSLVGFSFVFVFVLILLYQFILALVLMAAIGVLSVVALPTAMRVQRRKIAKQIKRIDLSGLSDPLRIRDFFTWKGWLKLAIRWGVWKTAGIYCLFPMIVIVAALYILIMYVIVRIEFVVVNTIFLTIFNLVLWHNLLSTVLKESQLSKPQEP
jgi:hypothetical protein